MNLKKLFGTFFVFVIFLFPVSVSAVPFLSVTGGTQAVFDHDDFSLIPAGETRTGTVISNSSPGSVVTNLFTDLFFNPLSSQGLGGFGFGDLAVNVFAGNQLALRGTDTVETNMYVSSGIEIRAFISEFLLPAIILREVNDHSTATMDIVPLYEQHYLFNIAVNGIDSNLKFTISSHPFDLGNSTLIPEPMTLILLCLGLLGMIGVRRRI